MSTSNDSPIVSFLTREENLLPALEVISRGTEIRDYAKKRFWDRVENEIKKAQPQDLKLRLSWDRKEYPEPDFELYARLSPIGKKTRGVQYAISRAIDCYGFGLRWINEPERDFEELLKVPLVNTLHRELTKTRQGDIDPESNQWWLWWEYWEKDLYDDSWIWFATKFNHARFFADTAKKFWEFVQLTYVQALKINEAVNRKV